MQNRPTANSVNPIVIAYHLVWTVYGWWLPNDPRGSGSHTVACDVLRDLGELHFGRKQVQPTGPAVRDFYERAAGLLKFPLMSFTPAEITIIGEAFAEVAASRKYTCWSCAIMPDHVHILIRKHRDAAEEMIQQIKLTARQRLWELRERWRDHPVWTAGTGWKVFLDHPHDVRRTIPYIAANPTKIRLQEQRWPFVISYNGWPLHPGHSPHSPYAKALRQVGRYP